MANAINFIDGLDGLAGGHRRPSRPAAFFLYAMQLGNAGLLQEGNIGPLIAIIVLGMCVGFLPFNVHPARIFMGDCGALLLGLLMAASTMVVGGRTDQPFSGQSYFFFAPLLIPLVILGVPIFDTVFAIVRRASKRKGVATADKDHLHHRLMRLGHGHRRSVLILWAWTALLSGFVAATRPSPDAAMASCRSASSRWVCCCSRSCIRRAARRARHRTRGPPRDRYRCRGGGPRSRRASGS